jgi:hypothetical protein
MSKSLLAVICLALPLAAFAAEGKHDNKPTHVAGAKHPAKAPTSPASSASAAADSRAAVKASKMRGSGMGACQKKAADQKLGVEERKAFMVTCMKG